MHELSIAEALVRQIQDVLEKEHVSRASSVTVRVGALSGVNTPALDAAFPFACESAGLSTPDLIVEDVPVALFCRTCQTSSDAVLPFMVCAHCDSTDVDVRAGHELMLKSVQLPD